MVQSIEAPFTREGIQDAPVSAKIRGGKEVVEKAFEVFDSSNIRIGFTGGKDSTLTAWLVKQVCEENGYDKPKFMFVDHGQHFDEIEEYVSGIAREWGFEVDRVANDDVIDKAGEPGDRVPVEELSDNNKAEAQRFDADEVPWLMDTKVGNHLLKTVPMYSYLRERGVKAVINGIRWDEHRSRSDEDSFSVRSDPDHLRVHPILQFSERDVWDATWFHVVADVSSVDLEEYPETVDDLPGDLGVGDVPVSPKYWSGFRSLGSEVSTDKSGEDPAWLQDVEGTDERGGRAQTKDEEKIMEELRDAGYM